MANWYGVESEVRVGGGDGGLRVTRRPRVERLGEVHRALEGPDRGVDPNVPSADHNER